MYMKTPHKSDIYSKTTSRNAAGQLVASWTTAAVTNQKCLVQPRINMVRVNPTSEEIREMTVYFPGSVNLTIDQRIYNIRDRRGNVLYPGPFEIISIGKEPGYTGKLHHLKVIIVSVME